MPEPVIAIQGLTLRRGGATVLEGLSLDVPAGRILGLIGPNGVGKSSLMAVVGGTLAYQGGSVRVAGREVAHDPFAARRAARAVHWPSDTNRALTGASYLRFLRAHRADAWRAEVAERLTEALGMADLMTRPILTYSHGTKGKLALIAALSFGAHVYLLDEALNGLDHRAARAVTAHLRGEAAAGRSVVLASHAVPLLHRACDEVAVLTRMRATVLPGGPSGGAEAVIEAALDDAYDAGSHNSATS